MPGPCEHFMFYVQFDIFESGLERELEFLLIAVARKTWFLCSACPADDCKGGSVDHYHKTEYAQEDIGCLAECGSGYGFEVEHGLY